MHFDSEVELKMILHWDHHAALERQCLLSQKTLQASVSLCAIRYPCHTLCWEEEMRQQHWRLKFLALVMFSLCCQSRRSNSSKSAWRKFGSFSVHLLLPRVGRTSGPLDKDGADVFSFSAALTEWFWWHTAHPERGVCALESMGLQREHWWRKAESRRLQGTVSFSRLQWPLTETWEIHLVLSCCLVGIQLC